MRIAGLYSESVPSVRCQVSRITPLAALDHRSPCRRGRKFRACHVSSVTYHFTICVRSQISLRSRNVPGLISTYVKIISALHLTPDTRHLTRIYTHAHSTPRRRNPQPHPIRCSNLLLAQWICRCQCVRYLHRSWSDQRGFLLPLHQ